MQNNLLTWSHCCQLTISRRSVLQVPTYFQLPWLAHPKRQLSIEVNGQWQSERQQTSTIGDCTMIGLKEAVKGPFSQDICPNIYTQAGRDTNADTESRSIPAALWFRPPSIFCQLTNCPALVHPFVNHPASLIYGSGQDLRSRCSRGSATQAAWEESVPGSGDLLLLHSSWSLELLILENFIEYKKMLE